MVEVGAVGPSGRAMVEEQCKRPLRCCRAGGRLTRLMAVEANRDGPRVVAQLEALVGIAWEVCCRIGVRHSRRVLSPH